MARYDDLNTNMIAYATVLSTVVLVVVLQSVQALTNGMIHSEVQRKISLSTDGAAEVKKAQLARLDDYKKVIVPDLSEGAAPNATKEIFTIPIQAAESLVLKEFATK